MKRVLNAVCSVTRSSPVLIERQSAIALVLASIISLGTATAVYADTGAAAHAKFMGTGTCASSNCHGGTAPRNSSNVLQNEYVTWLKQDKHSQSWKILLNDESKIIGKHLGIAAPEKEPLCLKCHSTYVPDSSQHGDKFNAEDGVSCESCHGAAEKWVETHAARDATHEKNLANGLADLSDLTQRSNLCLSCHFGSDDKTVDHRLIGAGHPRLNFELDTFGTIQPRHWQVDDDYKKRKGDYHPAQAWLVGQVNVASAELKKILSEKRSRFGAMPELTLFNCYSCHHDLTDDQWKKREYGGHPGELRLNLSSLVIAREAFKVVDQSAYKQLEKSVSEVEGAFRSGKTREALAPLEKALAGSLREKASTASIEGPTLDKLLVHMLEFGAANPWPSYETAEQVAMAVSSILAQKSPEGRLHQDQVNNLFKSLGNPDNFNPDGFVKACKEFLVKAKG